MTDTALAELAKFILVGDTAGALARLNAAPQLATAAFTIGATRQAPVPWYTGDTALHLAAARHDTAAIERLLALGADPRARNRRGVEPLHRAAAGDPTSPTWRPADQARAIALLIAAGADPNTVNMDGATPLHRAVRTRCAAAVDALLKAGANRKLRNKNGSTPFDLTQHTTGRGGSGSQEAKAELQKIQTLLA